MTVSVVGRHPHGSCASSGTTVSWARLLAALVAPVIGLHHPTRQHRPIRLEALAGHHQTELINAGEGGQVRASEGSVRHVEISRWAA